MKLLVNGEIVKLPDNANIIDLIEHLGCQNQRIALEVNETIIPKSVHEEFSLSDNDKIEIIKAVGGG
ncbi:MAG TPA: sulfur carrier protein ThiS [Candidatus Thioglobus sp.]|nr:sulfur carrier protein ThiS [Candidatus Thioglobus sp.]HIL21289.1 sulfur carrier protein ThiS [Candidatus Thioglobus sp.]